MNPERFVESVGVSVASFAAGAANFFTDAGAVGEEQAASETRTAARTSVAGRRTRRMEGSLA
jgi:hypothetical protein